MTRLIRILILLLSVARLANGIAQAVRLTPDMFASDHQIGLADMDGWVFHQGHDPSWARPDLDIRGWQAMKPTALSAGLADDEGRVEGWFRIALDIDSAFGPIPLGISRNLWAASDVYVDGVLVHAFGSTGRPYRAYNPHLKVARALPLEPGKKHLLAIHVVDYETTFTQRELRLNPHNLKSFVNIAGPGFDEMIRRRMKETYVVGSATIAVALLLLLLYLILLFLNPAERIFRFAAWMTLSVTLAAAGSYIGLLTETGYPTEKLLFLLTHTLFLPVMHALTLLITEWVLRRKISPITLAILMTMPVTSGLGHIFNISWPFGIVEMALLGYFAYLVVANLRSIRRAEWVVVIAMSAMTLGSLLWVYLHKYHLDTFVNYENVLKSTVMLSAPVMLLLYVALSYKQILHERREEERKVMRVTEEKRELLERQNERLESQVAERTRDLEATLTNLRSTQAQLIQSEKMASLGELTAGIAHEIQNPLNFVNNFAEVNAELLDEVAGQVRDGQSTDALDGLAEVRANEAKIIHHGNRASAIVKSMLQHSRTGTGRKEPTDLNALADEYLRLAYHGLRAKDKSFHADMKTDLDPALPRVDVVPEDIGRVLLNLAGNAFHAVSEKLKTAGEGYMPVVTVSTRTEDGHVVIRVSDNGPGIPDAIRDKIFQPFFTTKPTGQGTGLGLSLSYDIIKSHGGTLTIGPSTAEGTTFRIALPLPESPDGKH